MKKNQIIVIILLSIFMSCGETFSPNPPTQNGKIMKLPTYSNEVQTDNYQIIVIDGCQYIFKQNNGYQQGPIFTHKGDCNNPIHIYNIVPSRYRNGGKP